MRPRPLSVSRVDLPDFLLIKCQGMLDDIQRADSPNVALLTEQRAAGFTEALEWLQVLPASQIEQLYELYERALTGRIADLDH
ncbi:cysteine desulfurase [Pseudomonas sp. Marseille-Q5115]|uniref:cysteine desulfurase n=1 Tax=Pseudomonas sp. Marseille-Q5115 TaxID=2866593 RepID=UPI001CE42BEC|nr:cysteine desulfurase [Pseudomonas sp. Marseille-Q5115]